MASAKKQQDRIRALREEALSLSREGHEKKALLRFAELENLDPEEPDWPRRAAECHRVLGQRKEQVEALGRAAERYMTQGLVPKAIATCKVLLSINPTHTETQRRLGELSGSMQARFPIDSQLKRPPAVSPPAPVVSPPAPVVSPPAPDARIDARAPRLDEILRKKRATAVRITAEPEQEAPKPEASAPEISLPAPALSETEKTTETKIEAVYRPNGKPSGMFRITFPEPVLSKPVVDAKSRAQKALPTTPLFSELGPESLGRLIEQARLVEHEAGSVVYRKGDPSDALYVIVNGAVSIFADAEPRVEIARLGEGEVFGETALVGNELRLTSADAVERTELLRIDRALITDLVLSDPRTLRVALRFLRERLVQALVITNPLFTAPSKTQRGLFAQRFEFLQIERDSLLVEQGSASPGLYVLLCGKVSVTRREHDGEHVLARLNAGDVFGEMSLLNGEAAMADVKSEDIGFALRLPEWGFQDMGEDHPEVIEYLTLLAGTRRLQNDSVLEFGAPTPRRISSRERA